MAHLVPIYTGFSIGYSKFGHLYGRKFRTGILGQNQTLNTPSIWFMRECIMICIGLVILKNIALRSPVPYHIHSSYVILLLQSPPQVKLPKSKRISKRGHDFSAHIE